LARRWRKTELGSVRALPGNGGGSKGASQRHTRIDAPPPDRRNSRRERTQYSLDHHTVTSDPHMGRRASPEWQRKKEE